MHPGGQLQHYRSDRLRRKTRGFRLFIQCGCLCISHTDWDSGAVTACTMLNTPSLYWTMEVPMLRLRTWRLKSSGLWRWINGFRRFGGSRFLVEKPTGPQLIKIFAAFYGSRKFITVFTRAHHLSLSWATSIQSIPTTSHFLKIHFNIIFPSTPGFPKWFLSLGRLGRS
jgi:hypothetical protein